MAEKMKEIVDLANDLDGLDKAAWTEIIDAAESKTGEKLEAVMTEGEESLLKVLKEIAPFIKIVRLGLASDTISRVDRSRLVSMIIPEVSSLLSPMELVGVCFATAFKCLCTSRETPLVIPLPLGMECEKKDESKTVV